MFKLYYFISIACVIIVFGSCTKDADVKLPAVEPKLVINSFISPQDTIIRVEVTLSQPLYNNSNSNQYFKVSDATVQISDGTLTKTLVYDPVKNFYLLNASQFPIVVGGSYHLTVTTPDGKNVNASTTVPDANTSLSYTAQALNDPNFPDGYDLKVNWIDPTATEDYYRVAFYVRYVCQGCADTVSYAGLGSESISDKGNSSGLLSTHIFTSKANASGSQGYLHLLHASYEYYMFHLKLQSAAEGQNPFAEPVLMYSNINGGFGVFAGFNDSKAEVYF